MSTEGRAFQTLPPLRLSDAAGASYPDAEVQHSYCQRIFFLVSVTFGKRELTKIKTCLHALCVLTNQQSSGYQRVIKGRNTEANTTLKQYAVCF